MTTYTLNDLLYAKGTSEPVRQMLLAIAEKIERLEARLAQPEKEWVGLTDEEIKDILDCGRPDLVNIKKAEAKLKEKNSG